MLFCEEIIIELETLDSRGFCALLGIYYIEPGTSMLFRYDGESSKNGLVSLIPDYWALGGRLDVA